MTSPIGRLHDPAFFFLSSRPTRLRWVESPRGSRSGDFTAAAATEFLSIADSQLVAVAHARKLTVVTHEVPSNSKQRIKVPTACVGLGVTYASPYEMLRKERARFVLGSST
jgi:hypothetical protein